MSLYENINKLADKRKELVDRLFRIGEKLVQIKSHKEEIDGKEKLIEKNTKEIDNIMNELNICPLCERPL